MDTWLIGEPEGVWLRIPICCWIVLPAPTPANSDKFLRRDEVWAVDATAALRAVETERPPAGFSAARMLRPPRSSC